MRYYPSLSELLIRSPKSEQLYRLCSPACKEQMDAHRQSIHTYADLQKIACLFDGNPYPR